MKIKLKPIGKSGVRFKGWCRWVCADNYWWCHEKKKFVKYEKIGSMGASTSAPCKCVRQFKRMIRKNPHINGESILCSGYSCVGDIYSVAK